jgi:hypothetical protein
LDRDWWLKYGDEVNLVFAGRRLSTNSIERRFNVTRLQNIRSYANSGAGAMSAAIHAGAARLVLLGYDCQHTGGKSHWHGDHPIGLGNAGRVEAWHGEFANLGIDHPQVEILNATRETALECFKRVDLGSALWQT